CCAIAGPSHGTDGRLVWDSPANFPAAATREYVDSHSAHTSSQCDVQHQVKRSAIPGMAAPQDEAGGWHHVWPIRLVSWNRTASAIASEVSTALRAHAPARPRGHVERRLTGKGASIELIRSKARRFTAILHKRGTASAQLSPHGCHN